MTSAGFSDVETYINTGNIRFRTSLRSRARIEGALEAAFLADLAAATPGPDRLVLRGRAAHALLTKPSPVGRSTHGPRRGCWV